jgi:hypothetical protein
MLSWRESGGRIPGIRRASIVFPLPGGPLISMSVRNATRLKVRATPGKAPEVELCAA